MTRRDTEFPAEGNTLRGWFYPANESGGSARPTIVMAHRYSAFKEMYLDRSAEVFAVAGLNALVFDNRNFGASGGEPRQEIDAHHIGLWGSSYSGGHVLVVAAIDRRAKAVVGQGTMVDGYQNFRRLVRPISSEDSRSSSTRTAWLDSTASHPRWCLPSRKIRTRRQRCRRQIPTSGSQEATRIWRPRGGTK